MKKLDALNIAIAALALFVIGAVIYSFMVDGFVAGVIMLLIVAVHVYLNLRKKRKK